VQEPHGRDPSGSHRHSRPVGDGRASLEVTIPDPQLAELDQATRPQLDFPAGLLRNIAPAYRQAGATINGVESAEFRR
jgi:hypothetical protein